MEIIEGNKLIAEFMGAIPLEESSPLLKLEFGFHHMVMLPENMKFHSTWDWLMPVVEKIESTEKVLYCEITNNNCRIAQPYPLKTIEIYNRDGNKSKIEVVWEACVQFIKWHNEKEKYWPQNT